MDPREQAIQELLEYLSKRDSHDLGESLKPKGVEVTKVSALGGEGEPSELGESTAGEKSPGEAPEVEGAGGSEGGEPKMSEEELKEMIEALQSQLGA